MPNIYPVHQFAYESGTYAHSPDLARSIWLRIRKQDQYKDVGWYAAECEINLDSVTLHILDMADVVYGGLGRRVLTVEVKDLTNKESDLRDNAVYRAQLEAAESELKKREATKRLLQIEQLRKEMFDDPSTN